MRPGLDRPINVTRAVREDAMTKAGRPAPGAIQIIPKPPFVRLPDPARLFADRAARFRRLAEGHAPAISDCVSATPARKRR